MVHVKTTPLPNPTIVHDIIHFVGTRNKPDNTSERAVGQSLVTLSQGLATKWIPAKVLSITRESSSSGTIVTISNAPVEKDAHVLAAYKTVENMKPILLDVGTST